MAGITRVNNGQTIDDFCSSTFDSNKLHDSKSMHADMRYSIVPGMLTLSQALVELAKKTQAVTLSNFSMGVNFGSPLRENEEVLYCWGHPHGNSIEIQISAMGEKGNAFMSEKGSSSIKLVGVPKITFPTLSREFYLEQNRYNTFLRVLNTGDSPFSQWMYAMACSSSAIVRALFNPQTDMEKKIKEKMDDEKAKSLCVYTAMDIERRGTSTFGQNIVYKTHLVFDGARSIQAYTAGSFGENEVLAVRAELALVPEKVLYRKVAVKMPELTHS